MIIGDQEDEGTLLALFQDNITTENQVVDYLSTKFFPHATLQEIEDFVTLYADTDANGSPYRTSSLENWYPQFKRLAAILGDLTFTLTRRAALLISNGFNPDVPTWSYLSSYDYGTPILGTFHGSDLLQVFFGIKDNYASHAFHSYYISFVNNLDPNGGGYANWPKWGESQQLLNMSPNSSKLIPDTFRSDAFNYILGHINSFYI
jgi:carboxylesterase type B